MRYQRNYMSGKQKKHTKSITQTKTNFTKLKDD